jgi:hypothetical protein
MLLPLVTVYRMHTMYTAGYLYTVVTIEDWTQPGSFFRHVLQ